MLVKKTKPMPVECVVRGFLAGSGWKEYKENRSVCGIKLPEALVESSRLPEPLFTPSTKEEEGHDMNISFDEVVKKVGVELAVKLRGHESERIHKGKHSRREKRDYHR